MTSHVAVITGISGLERYLKGQEEVTDRKKAQRFRSPVTAEAEAKRHIKSFPRVVAKAMTFRVEAA